MPDVDSPPAETIPTAAFEPQYPGSIRVRPIFLFAGLAAALTIVIGIGAYFALSHRAAGVDPAEIIASPGDGLKSNDPEGGIPQTRISISDSARRAAIAAAIAADASQTEVDHAKPRAPEPVQQKSARQSTPENVKKPADEKKTAGSPRVATRAESVKRDTEPRRSASNAQLADVQPRVADAKASQAAPKNAAQNYAASDQPKLQIAARAERSNQPVCADSPNLFSREICLWRECERPEYRQTAECARFSRSAN